MTERDKLVKNWKQVSDAMLKSPWIKDLYEFRKKSRKEDTLVRDFLQVARQDLEATKILYQSGHYNLAVFHLQQAIEKAAKAYALDSFLITRRDLRKIGHSSPMAFLTILDKEIGLSYISLVRGVFPEMSKNLSESKSMIRSKQYEVARAPPEKILGIMKSVKQLSDQLPEMLTEVIQSIIPNLPSLVRFLPNDEELSKFLNSLREKSNEKEPVMLDELIKGILNAVAWYMLSALTFPHESFTRYPDLVVKPSEYSKDLGIVQVLDKIIPEVEKAISDLSLSTSGKPVSESDV